MCGIRHVFFEMNELETSDHADGSTIGRSTLIIITISDATNGWSLIHDRCFTNIRLLFLFCVANFEWIHIAFGEFWTIFMICKNYSPHRALSFSLSVSYTHELFITYDFCFSNSIKLTIRTQNQKYEKYQLLHFVELGLFVSVYSAALKLNFSASIRTLIIKEQLIN